MRGLISATAVVLAFVSTTLVSHPAATAFEISRVIAPTITAHPVQVVLWVLDDVSADDEVWVRDEVRAALDAWASVPTTHIRFEISTIRSAMPPSIAPEQLLVIAPNSFALGGGALGPTLEGNPGSWIGAIANWRTSCFPAICDAFQVTARHELGHAIGFRHSTVSTFAFSSNIPVMHFASALTQDLTPDDIALVSTAYPNPDLPLSQVSGRLHGRCVDAATKRPLDGVNVVAVDTATGAPAVGRLAGAAGDPGAFDVVGLPPATYDLRFLDGASFVMSDCGLTGNAIQLDSFAPFVQGPFTIAAGTSIDLGEVSIAIPPATLAARAPYSLDGVPHQPYLIRDRILGGVRPFTIAAVSGLPAGFAVRVRDGEAATNANDHGGRSELEFTAAPEESLHARPRITLCDAHGTQSVVVSDLRVRDDSNYLCASGWPLEDARVTFKKLAPPAGDTMVTLQGTLRFPAGAPSVFDPATTGAQLLIFDLSDPLEGFVVDFEVNLGHYLRPNDRRCDPRDGWRATRSGITYVNESNMVDAPTCTPGSANGLQLLQFRDHRARRGTMHVKMKMRGATLRSIPKGPLRVTLVYGQGGTAFNGGDCSNTVAPLPCSPADHGMGLDCRAPAAARSPTAPGGYPKRGVCRRTHR